MGVIRVGLFLVLLALLLNLLLYVVLFLDVLLLLAVGQLGPRLLLLGVLRDHLIATIGCRAMPAGARAQAREAASLLGATPLASSGAARTSIVLLGLVCREAENVRAQGGTLSCQAVVGAQLVARTATPLGDLRVIEEVVAVALLRGVLVGRAHRH